VPRQRHRPPRTSPSSNSLESDVTRKIEESVNTISGIDEISSHSYNALSVVIVQFDLSINVMQAAQDVRDKVALLNGNRALFYR
jgi:HAE1 family hydrophobic/amphiphilic exporter-1